MVQERRKVSTFSKRNTMCLITTYVITPYVIIIFQLDQAHLPMKLFTATVRPGFQVLLTRLSQANISAPQSKNAVCAL